MNHDCDLHKIANLR